MPSHPNWVTHMCREVGARPPPMVMVTVSDEVLNCRNRGGVQGVGVGGWRVESKIHKTGVAAVGLRTWPTKVRVRVCGMGGGALDQGVAPHNYSPHSTDTPTLNNHRGPYAKPDLVYGSTKGFVSYGGFTHVGFSLHTSVSPPTLYPSSLQLPLSPLSLPLPSRRSRAPASAVVLCQQHTALTSLMDGRMHWECAHAIFSITIVMLPAPSTRLT
jgi:hypothetical protein